MGQKVIKPVYGFLSDSVPLFGYRRRSYLALAGVLGSASWLSLGFAVATPLQACVALTCTSLGVAVSDVVVDSIVVAKARDAQASGPSDGHPNANTDGALQSLCWGASAVGSVLSAYSGKILNIRYSP